MNGMKMNGQSGAVSLFVVIFAALLITVVTVSFLRIMVNDQTQASNTDLSQSALDSALAGVEDAKRVLLRYQKVCAGSAGDCALLASQITTNECNAALLIGGVVSGANEGASGNARKGEIKVQQSTSTTDSKLDQAYTCVTIALNTDTYVGTVARGDSKLIPLIGDGDITDVTIDWFSNEDVGTSTNGEVNLEGVGEGKRLYATTSWPANRPSILRTQLMQFGSEFTLESFDTTNASGESNTNTVFLYPTTNGGSAHSFVGRDSRKENPADLAPADTAALTPAPVTCSALVTDGRYACSVTLSLPTPVGGGARTAFLRLTPYYNATDFQVRLSNSGTPVRFQAVQPEIDSTGRANDLFKRVQSRVELYNTSFPFPDGAVDVTGNFCKDFAVTNSQYIGGDCTP